MDTATRPPPHHDNLTCYKNYGCRLPACVERHRAYGRQVARRQAYGTWQPFVDAEPARQHLLARREEGITILRVTELTGLSSGTISRLLYDFANRPRCRHLRAENAAKILAIAPEHATPDITDATGTRRRIEALQIIGWPKQIIARRLGLSVNTAGRVTRQPVVRTSTAYAVAALYDDLRLRLPENHGVTPWVADRARRHARMQGWHGPLAWDGNIDDPAAQPDTTGVGVDDIRKRDNLRNDEIKHLAGFGLSAYTIAKQVGLEEKDVQGRIDKMRAEKAHTKQAVA